MKLLTMEQRVKYPKIKLTDMRSALLGPVSELRADVSVSHFCIPRGENGCEREASLLDFAHHR